MWVGGRYVHKKGSESCVLRMGEESAVMLEGSAGRLPLLTRTEKVESLYGMGWNEGRSWLDHIESLDDEGLSPLTKYTQRYLHEFQNPPLEECASKQFFEVAPGTRGQRMHGLGSLIHVLSYDLYNAVENNRILMWSEDAIGALFVEDACGQDNIRSFDCIFMPLSHCPRSSMTEENTIKGNVGYEPESMILTNSQGLPTFFREKLDEHFPWIPTASRNKYWWRGQAAAYFMRLRPESLTHIQNIRMDPAKHEAFTLKIGAEEPESLEFPFPLHRGTFSIYIRHGDKGREMSLHPLEEYVVQAETVASLNPNGYARMAFLSSEDPEVFVKAKNLTAIDMDGGVTPNLEWNWYSSHIGRINGGPFSQLDQLGNRTETTLSWMAELMLSLECDAFVGTRGSNWNRIIDELSEPTPDTRLPELAPATMRPSLSLVAAFALLLPTVLADPSPKPCSDHPGVVHPAGTFGDVATSSTSTTKTKSKGITNTKSKGTTKSSSTTKFKSTAAKKKTPVIKSPSAKTIVSGAQDAVAQFSDLIPAGVSSDLKTAISQALSKQLGVVNTTVVQTGTSTSLVTTVTAKPKKKVATKIKGVPTTITVYENVTLTSTQLVNVTSTATITADSAASSAVNTAAINIQQAIDSAFAATDLSQSGLDNATVASLEACLTQVLAAGGLPSNYTCITSSGSDSSGLTATLNTILEQFEGILPNIILQQVFDAVTPTLTTLLPASEAALVAQIQSSIQSVIATTTSSSVQAMEQLQTCYAQAIQMQGNTSSLACFTTSGAAATLQSAANSVVEQFSGVLPGSLVTQVENIASASNDSSTDDLAAKVQAQISSAIISAGNTISGNTVSLVETLQGCATLLLTTANATAAQECVTSGNAPILSTTIVLGIAEQFNGYLPSAFFSDLVEASEPLIANITLNPTGASQATINAALNAIFNNITSYGPAFETCIEQVETCVKNAVIATGTIDAVCPGPVSGCSESTPERRRFRRHREMRAWSSFTRKFL
ncbi:Proteophosphoglycan ppg4 [Pseudohyphozyma bogoriensis]|nr:Proteophosphoglycan ppg4 [Pseudohyphozyma bogoriensis]